MTGAEGISPQRLRAARDRVAELMVEQGRPQFAPIFERLESECARLDDADAAMARARALIERRKAANG